MLSSWAIGEVAQLVEQRTENPRVAGSIPALATSFKSKHQRQGEKPPPTHHQSSLLSRIPQRVPCVALQACRD